MCPTRRAGSAGPFGITGVVEQNQVNRDYEAFIDIIRNRRSVRRFEKGRSSSREMWEWIAPAISKDMEVEHHASSVILDTC